MLSHLEKINALIATFDQPTERELDMLSAGRSFKKGEYLVQPDRVCTQSFWLLSGSCRKFYLHDGSEITTELYFADDLVVAFQSYVTQQPGREYIQAMTDVTAQATDYALFYDAKKQNPKLAELDLLITEYYALWLENRLFEFRTQSATTRYVNLLKKSPHIIQQIPLTIIASYLGISLETLSRIRARI